MQDKSVGILGSGQVAQALAKGFVSIGYKVKMGSRSPEKLEEWTRKSATGVRTGSFSEAASFGGDIIVLAVLGEGVENALDLSGAANFSGKVVIDATNPLDFSRGMPPGILPRFRETSIGETVQKKLPESKVVKCFNSVPNVAMFQPKFPHPEMFICGNDKPTKEKVTNNVLRQFGWAGTIDFGGIENSKWLELMVPAWVIAAGATGSWYSMFKLER